MFPISDNGDFGFDPTFPFSFSHLPSLCDLLDADGCEAFPSQPDPSQNSGSAMNYFSRADDGSGGGGGGGGKQRKRASKRDRHSKIVTARGLRDRRMRLSLEVARKFFGLQDLLGYEKASKTVEWLLLQANAEIKKLSRSLSMANPAAARTIAEFVGDCEVGNSSNKRSKPKPSSDKTGTNKLRKSAASRGLARDQRAKARERAKARTIAKKRSRECEGFKPNEATQQQLTSWEAGKEALPSTSSMNNIQPDHDTFVSNPMIFSCPPNNGIPQEHQVLNGLSSFGKPWEAYNNHNNLVNNIYHGSRTIV